MTFDDETLMAYADGESKNAAAIEAELAVNPALAARVAQMRALRRTIAGAFAPIADEPVPGRLIALTKRPLKQFAGVPAVIKSAPLYPFVALSAAAVALIACIVAAPQYIPALKPLVVASANDKTVASAPAIAPNHKISQRPVAPPLELAASSPPAFVSTEAVWVEQPDARTVERYYPARAAAQNVSGKAVLNCLVNADGSVGCVVGSEYPGDWGFGEAAIEVARHFQLAQRAANGMRTADGRVTIPVTFAPRNCGATPSALTLDAAATPIANPIWLKRPSVRDLARDYPPRALERGRSGHAVVRCLIALDGALTHCVMTGETPAGWGFGDAAIKMAQKFRAAPKTAGGEATPGRAVNLPITFKTER